MSMHSSQGNMELPCLEDVRYVNGILWTKCVGEAPEECEQRALDPVQSETFNQFLQLKFPNLKRYGLGGGGD